MEEEVGLKGSESFAYAIRMSYDCGFCGLFME